MDKTVMAPRDAVLAGPDEPVGHPVGLSIDDIDGGRRQARTSA